MPMASGRLGPGIRVVFGPCWCELVHKSRLRPGRNAASREGPARNCAFDKAAVTLTLMLARTGGDDRDDHGPRVADSNRKQRQHTDSHKGEAALGVVE